MKNSPNVHKTQEDALEELKGWRHIGRGVYGRGRKRAYVSAIRDVEAPQREGRPEYTVRGWIVSYWPIEKTQGRVSREELGGKAWM